MDKGPDFYLKTSDTSTSEAQLFAPPPPDTSCDHRVYQFSMPVEMLDIDAAKVVRRLSRYGFDAFLVGGSVRDTLFGVRPKDFDVATSALPNEIKRLFRNCRLIGRRFRLAHLLFRNNKIIEVATFRRNPTSDDDVSGRHAAENLFGGPADDAIRRDFTINALMYDVGKREIHDYVGGIADIEARVLRTIGDPNRRFLEDPVRIIRAVKFANRLSLKMDPEMVAAARAHAHLVSECAPARLVEELYKVLRTGRATACLKQLHDFGVLEVLMPGYDTALKTLSPDEAWGALTQADALMQSTIELSDVTLLSAMFYPFSKEILTEKGDTAAKIQQRVQELTRPMTFPKRCIALTRQILTAQRRLAAGPKTARARRLLDRDYAIDALNLMRILVDEDETLSQPLSEWQKLEKKRRPRSTENCTFKKRRHRPRRAKRRKSEETEKTPQIEKTAQAPTRERH